MKTLKISDHKSKIERALAMSSGSFTGLYTVTLLPSKKKL